jgi:hypothetical protein
VPFDFVVARNQTTWRQHFQLPALRKNAKERGTYCVGDASEIKSLGHPPNAKSLLNLDRYAKLVGESLNGIGRDSMHRLPEAFLLDRSRERGGR